MNKVITFLKIDDLPYKENNLYDIDTQEECIENFFSIPKSQFTFKNGIILNNNFEYQTLCSLNKYIQNVENQKKYDIDLNRINGINFPVKLPPYYTFNFKAFSFYNKFKNKDIKIVYLKS